MNKNSQMVVANRPRGFIRPEGAAWAAPPSPMVLQMLMQSILALNEKVDGLAVSRSQPIIVQSMPTPAPIARRHEEPSPPPASSRQVDRSLLQEIFD